MQRLEVSGAVRPLYGPLGVNGLRLSSSCLRLLVRLCVTFIPSSNVPSITRFSRQVFAYVFLLAFLSLLSLLLTSLQLLVLVGR